MSKSFFDKVVKGLFIDRPNRFIVNCWIDGQKKRAYLPNPGRLWELFFPNRSLYLTPNREGQKTEYTVVAVERDGMPIMLHTHVTNKVVQHLIETNRVPGLEGAEVVKAEATSGHHRFDFLLRYQGRPYMLEVKSCTLFEGSVAMFPDAVTERGRSHLESLAQLAQNEEIDCGVLFLVQWPRGRFFLPDYHADLAFAQTFYELRNHINYQALAISWNDDLTLAEGQAPLTIPWDYLSQELNDGGSYLIVMHLPERTTLTVGSLGEIILEPAYYVYVGTAKTNLTQRVNRHLRKKKTLRWHVDYLREKATTCSALPIRTTERIEHDLAGRLASLAQWTVPGFGCSDCKCTSHLFAFTDNPQHSEPFIEMLQYFRMGRVEERLLSPLE
ncbi:DNA/RNA nuclease SfsA [Heliorestis acidaminivorans]|uniref:DNA/RNA nuclease SfsA n=1 Tax=Heliorestis acidaminivorans TaxID=553427 RepID=A0A6I0F0G7_9FIRM|nr:DNA/RNA nuclease SfsA [Heliorestis acidaminivorans]KAB2951795.1 DNA/RNA nuclease SfsA [Heliorestis acidaminivorans]